MTQVHLFLFAYASNEELTCSNPTCGITSVRQNTRSGSSPLREAAGRRSLPWRGWGAGWRRARLAGAWGRCSWWFRWWLPTSHWCEACRWRLAHIAEPHETPARVHKVMHSTLINWIIMKTTGHIQVLYEQTNVCQLTWAQDSSGVLALTEYSVGRSRRCTVNFSRWCSTAGARCVLCPAPWGPVSSNRGRYEVGCW